MCGTNHYEDIRGAQRRHVYACVAVGPRVGRKRTRLLDPFSIFEHDV